MRPGHGQQLLVAAICLVVATAGAATESLQENLPNPTHAGYLDVERNAGSKIYYQYYEADSECRQLCWQLMRGPPLACRHGC